MGAWVSIVLLALTAILGNRVGPGLRIPLGADRWVGIVGSRDAAAVELQFARKAQPGDLESLMQLASFNVFRFRLGAFLGNDLIRTFDVPYGFIVPTLSICPIVWSWRRRRALARARAGRCAACGYDTRSLTQCPECGTGAQSVDDLIQAQNPSNWNLVLELCIRFGLPLSIVWLMVNWILFLPLY